MEDANNKNNIGDEEDKIIFNERNPQHRYNSICRSNLLKSNDRVADKCEHIIDMALHERNSEVNKNNLQIKYKDQGLTTRKPVDMVDYTSNDQVHLENYCKIKYDSKIFKLKSNIQKPQIIFNNDRKGQKLMKRKNFKINTHISNVRKLDFKYKLPLKNKIKKLQKNYNVHSNLLNLMQKDIFKDCTSVLVSKKQGLKRVPAEVNFLNAFQSVLQDFSYNEKYTEPLIHSSNGKRTPNNVSNDTMVFNVFSFTEDLSSIKNKNSVIKLTTNKLIPVKANVINVAAVHNRRTNETKKMIKKLSEQFLSRENLTSNESVIETVHYLTSEPPSNKQFDVLVKKDFGRSVNHKESSNITLTDKKSSSLQSINDSTYTLAKNSSDFIKDESSNFTLTTDSENLKHSIILKTNVSDSNYMYETHNKVHIRDTIIDIGMFPEIAPSTSFKYNQEKHISNEITDYSFNLKRNGFGDKFSNTFVTKSFTVDEEACPIKQINLPNTDILKSMLKENSKTQNIMYSGEPRSNYTNNLSEMWDRFLLILDLTVQKLEQALAEKIVKELEKSFIISKNSETNLKKHNSSKDNVLKLHKDVIKNKLEATTQYELVKCIVVDNFTKKLTDASTQIIIPDSIPYNQKLKPKLVKDYFEVLKAPIQPPITDVAEKGDAVTVSTTTTDDENTERVNRSLWTLFTAPIYFVRENILLVTGVSTFFIAVLCVYGLILLVSKML